MKSTIYKFELIANSRVLGFFDSLYFNAQFAIRQLATIYSCRWLLHVKFNKMGDVVDKLYLIYSSSISVSTLLNVRRRCKAQGVRWNKESSSRGPVLSSGNSPTFYPFAVKPLLGKFTHCRKSARFLTRALVVIITIWLCQFSDFTFIRASRALISIFRKSLCRIETCPSLACW